MDTIESSLKEIWVNKLTSIKEKKIRTNESLVKGKEILKILDTNNQFWIKWYELLNKEIASFYLDLRVIDNKANGVWSEVTFEIGQDIILKESPDDIQRVRGQRFFAKLKKEGDSYYIYTLKEIINNKLYDIERFSEKYVDDIYKRYEKLKESKIEDRIRGKYDYKRAVAISYAYRFNRFRNRYYPFIADNNTTNYISQCLDSAGISQRRNIWYCKPKDDSLNTKFEDYNISLSWYGFDEFFDVLLSQKIGVESLGISNLIIGDVIQTFNYKDDEYRQTMIVSKKVNKEIFITSQFKNKSFMDYPLYLLYPSRRFNKFRFIMIL